MAFRMNERVRLAVGAPESRRTGSIALVAISQTGRGQTRYAVRWDDGPTVPGYLEKELESLHG